MSGIASMALPGRIPTYVAGKGRINPEDIFSSQEEKEEYKRILSGKQGGNIAPDVRIKKVCVKIFDLSDDEQVKEYERLWAELLEKVARMEVLVESQKDLVKRPDGTSYWMKYVEYVEYGDASEGNDKSKSAKDGEWHD